MARFKGLLTEHFIRKQAIQLARENVIALPPETDMREVVRILNQENCGSVIVENEDDAIIGIVTERDVLMKIVQWGTNTAQDIMTPSPQVIRKNGSIARALHAMSIGGFRHLPVVHHEKYVEGILSVKDVVRDIYDVLLKHHIGEKCDVIGEKNVVQQYFCSTLEIFSFKNPICVSVDASTHDAIQALKTAKSGGIFIVDGEQKLKGIFTDRDFITRIAGNDIDRKKIPITSYMTREPEVSAPTDTVHSAYGKMSEGGFRHLPVVDGEKVLGMLSVKDFMDLLVEEIIEQLESVQAQDKS